MSQGVRYTHSARAEEDLIGIWTYVAADNPAAADRLLDRIEAACSRLARYPRLGPARSDLAPGMRYYVVSNYLILYRENAGQIDIVRVVHGARFLPDLI